MGAGQSTAAGTVAGSHVAFNVLRIHPNSPASQAGLIPYFDYIVSVNGVLVIQEMPNVVAEMAKTHVGKAMRMQVYNARNDAMREVTIVPRTGWGGDGLLGCSIRFSSYDRAIDRVWRILDTAPDSPGFRAGLVPLKDWIIGSVDLALNSEDDFYQLLIQNKKRPVKLIVFNLDSNACREVSVVPDFEWGGNGCLGCDIGTGVLNRVPVDQSQVVPNLAGGDKESLLAGQGLLREEWYERPSEQQSKNQTYSSDIKSPGRPVPIAENNTVAGDQPLTPVIETAPLLVAHDVAPETVTAAPSVNMQQPPASEIHPLFADAPVDEEDFFK